VIAAETGYLDLAHDYVAESALVDLRDLNGNTREGVHIASSAGGWLGLVAGFGGMRDHDGVLSFAPRLPSRIGRLEFALTWRGLHLRVTVTADDVTYELPETDEGEIEFTHHGEALVVRAGEPATRPIPSMKPLVPPPAQPLHREPLRRTFPD
jgi:alpha,alpha-trehalose phosphorylase